MDADLQILKDRSIQYEVDLVKTRVDETILTELRVLDIEIPELDVLEREINTNEDFNALRDLVKYLKAEIPARIHRELKEELSEIREDLKWKQTEQGRKVIELENWIQNARTKLDLRREDSTIFIGKSFSDPLKLLITGRLTSKKAKEELVSSVEDLMPPVTPNYDVEIKITTPNKS